MPVGDDTTGSSVSPVLGAGREGLQSAKTVLPPGTHLGWRALSILGCSFVDCLVICDLLPFNWTLGQLPPLGLIIE